MSVDTLLASLESYSHEALTPKEILIINKDLRELKTNLHSLLISKLPEKKEGTIQLESYSETDIDQIEEDMKVVVTYRLGFNKAVDDMHRVIDEMFGVQND